MARLLAVSLMSQQCFDPIVGKILAGWRYEIYGLAPETRGDYELHFSACEHCRRRQRIHRIIDVSLIALFFASAGVFLLAFGVIRHSAPRYSFWLQIAGLAGFVLSALIWFVVAFATRAMVMVDAAKPAAQRVQLVRRNREKDALRLLDAWGAILPVRIATEDLGDYMEDIHRRADEGQRWLLWLRVITALVWTGINAVGFVSKNLLGKDVESRTGKQPSK